MSITTGTGPASARGINVPLAYTTAYTVFGLGCIVAARIPNNAGSLLPLTVSAPEGWILNAPKPAPVASRHVIGQMLPDVVFGCLRQAIPDRVPAEGTSCLWNLNVRGQSAEDTGNYGFTMTVTSNGGTGARPMKDGLSATAYPSGVKGTPVEIAEIGDAADLLAEGARPIPAAPAAPAAASARSSRSRAASAAPSTSLPPTTASTIRPAAATAGATGRRAMSASSPAGSSRARASRRSRPATGSS